MGDYYEHPFRNFGRAKSDAVAQESKASAPEPEKRSSPKGEGEEDSDNRNGSFLGILLNHKHAKILLPAFFIVFSVAYIYIYDSLSSYSDTGAFSRSRARGSSMRDSVNDEELSDRAFESSNERGNWRPPVDDDGTRSVEEARSNAGFFGRLFCTGLRRSKWCQ